MDAGNLLVGMGVTALVLCGYEALRRRRLNALHQELGRPLVAGDKPGGGTQMGLWEKVIEPGAVGAVTAYDAVCAIAMMDDRVLEAMDFSSRLDLDTFNELSSYVRDHFLSGSEASVAGAAERLQGYTAEQMVAAHLAAQGHVVEFPDTPNQEGWDLLVDGHPVQVKCTLDPGLVKEHLEKFPDIPVIVNAELGHYFADNSHVIVDKDLLHSQVAEHVQSTVDGVHALDTVHFHVPVVTLALSTVREGVLWAAGRITLPEAAKRVGTDVALAGGGGFAGGKLGAVLGGMFLGPVGAGIGAVAGAVAGFVLGKKAARGVRMAPYEEAKRRLNEALFAAVQVVPEAIESRIAALRSKVERVRRRLRIGPFSWLWPSRRYLIYREFVRRIEEKIGALREKATWVVAAAKDYHERARWENGLYRPGLEVCRWVIEEGKLYHPRLIAALKEADACAVRLVEEARRLEPVRWERVGARVFFRIQDAWRQFRRWLGI